MTDTPQHKTTVAEARAKLAAIRARVEAMPPSTVPPEALHEPTRPEDMRWPGLRAKLLPVTVIRVPFGWRPSIGFRNWYHGCWWQVCIGPWVIIGGSGTYE